MILKGFLLEQSHGSSALATERFDNREVGSKDHCGFKSQDPLPPLPSHPPGTMEKECAMEGCARFETILPATNQLYVSSKKLPLSPRASVSASTKWA